MSELLDKHFTTKPDGITGNYHPGTISPRSVFSMLGFYPDVPGVPEYTLVTPTFDTAVVNLGDHDLTVSKEHGPKAMILLDGKPVGHRISHDSLVNARTLRFITPEK